MLRVIKWDGGYFYGYLPEDRADCAAGASGTADPEQGVAEECIPRRYYSCVAEGKAAGIECLISRTGYTGEDGFELYIGQ